MEVLQFELGEAEQVAALSFDSWILPLSHLAWKKSGRAVSAESVVSVSAHVEMFQWTRFLD